MNNSSVMFFNNVAKVNQNKPATNNSYNQNVGSYSNIHFTSNSVNTGIRTSLSGKAEKAKYKFLTKNLDRNSKKLLHTALKTGILLNNNSNDKSTVLDNLYNIATKDRAKGLDNNKILKDTLISVTDPYTITQKFGDIPTEYKEQVIGELTHHSMKSSDRIETEKQITDLFSGCCVAASEQFNLAKRQPAEYTRFVEGLSSPKKSVDKGIKLNSLSENTMDAIWLLNAFEIPYTPKDFNTVNIKIKPDKNAYIRAEIQQNYRDNKERSSVDVLMQSAFMNTASQQTYNALNDKRGGKFSNEDSGLIDFEKTFLESVVEDKNTMSVTYQTVDENQTLVGYETDYDTVKSQLTETLDRNQNVIIGYTITDNNNKIIGAHEITITDYKTNKNGELIFVCNDTDDDYDGAIEYSANYIIPKIHHAGIPEDIAMKTVESTETWRYNLREISNKQQNQQCAPIVPYNLQTQHCLYPKYSHNNLLNIAIQQSRYRQAG